MRSPLLAGDSGDQIGRIRRSATPALTARSVTTTKVRRAASRDPLGGTTVDQSTARAITSVSGGVPVPETVRRSAEEASGHDLGDVRIHEGAAPAELSASLQATAFTVGSNIFLGGDAARPGTTAGDHLLAHELGHVVDDGAGSTVGRVRRLVSGASLRDDLGGPSSGSKTYRALIKDLDSYATATNNPLTSTDPKVLIGEANKIDFIVKRIINTCTTFLDGHAGDERAGRIAAIKADATRERGALLVRTNELKRGTRPTWKSWSEALAADGARQISAEGGFQGGGAKGGMNELTQFSFGSRVKIGERDTRERSFFKADKENITGAMEEGYASGIGIPLGPAHGEDAQAGPRFAARAVASYRIDRLLNANVIAKTQFAVRNTPDGPVQGQLMTKARGKMSGSVAGERDVTNPGAARSSDPAGMADPDDPALQRLLSKLDLVDSLCGQIDRHGGNVFVERDKDGRTLSVTGIDNDMAFGTENFTVGETSMDTYQYAGIGKYIDQETGEAVLKLTAADLHAVLDDLLLPNEVDAAIRRLEQTQAIVQQAKADGRLIGPERWNKETAATGDRMGGKLKTVGYHANLLHQTAAGMD